MLHTTARFPTTTFLSREMRSLLLTATLATATLATALPVVASQAGDDRADEPPNIVLVMADDQGWGQVGYYQHPVLKTPNLDAMAAGGLRFDRFYAGAPNCSPTRATVLTGRSNDRCGVHNHGFALRLQERTLASALQQAGYSTGHFGKWHLNGHRGPGAPILADDARHPGHFGFDAWLSTSNFFDRNPILSREGRFEEFQGDSSEIIVEEALKFIEQQVAADKSFLAVIWFGTPHSPWMSGDADSELFDQLPNNHRHHYGELVAMDRSIGVLRKGLRSLRVADDTLVWYCSDNGGLRPFGPETVRGLRGWKNTVFEGGLRVPAIVEWPAVVQPRISEHAASTLDIFPTIADIVGLSDSALQHPQDGVSLRELLSREIARREKPIPFRHTSRAAWIDNDLKLVTTDIEQGDFQLYDLANDPLEEHDLASERPDLFRKLRSAFQIWNASVEASVAGRDYPEGRVEPADPKPISWTEEPGYAPYFADWAQRPEYRAVLQRLKSPRD